MTYSKTAPNSSTVSDKVSLRQLLLLLVYLASISRCGAWESLIVTCPPHHTTPTVQNSIIYTSGLGILYLAHSYISGPNSYPYLNIRSRYINGLDK